MKRDANCNKYSQERQKGKRLKEHLNNKPFKQNSNLQMLWANHLNRTVTCKCFEQTIQILVFINSQISLIISYGENHWVKKVILNKRMRIPMQAPEIWFQVAEAEHTILLNKAPSSHLYPIEHMIFNVDWKDNEFE